MRCIGYGPWIGLIRNGDIIVMTVGYFGPAPPLNPAPVQESRADLPPFDPFFKVMDIHFVNLGATQIAVRIGSVDPAF